MVAHYHVGVKFPRIIEKWVFQRAESATSYLTGMYCRFLHVSRLPSKNNWCFNMNRNNFLAASVMSSGLLLAGCAIPPNANEGYLTYNFEQAFNNPDACSNNARNIGIAIGILAGAAAGALIKHNIVAAAEGAAVGGATGYLVGHFVDKRRCDAYHIATANKLEIASANLKADQIGEPTGFGENRTIGSNVIIQNNGQFESGSAELTQGADRGLPQLAEQYTPETIASEGGQTISSGQSKIQAANDRTVLVISRASGDQDSSQSTDQLTTDRAKAVAKVMADAGVPAENIYYQGAGDSESIVPTDAPGAESVNNSTQILDFPNRAAMQEYLSKTKANPPASTITSQTNTIPAPATGVSPDESVKVHYVGYDFGGQRVVGTPGAIALGLSNPTPGLSLISRAYASSPMNIKACVFDHPRHAAPVINYATGAELPVSGAIPGFYGAPWEGGFHGNLIDALNVYVPIDADQRVPDPTVEIYKDYHNGMTRPSFRKVVAVNVYRSQDKVLYRMFVDGPMKCIDLVVKKDSPEGQGTLYYNHNGQLYSASGKLALQN